MDEGNYDAACPKLKESYRLSPGGGTLLNLALCHEKQGKLATAWTQFKDALARAKKDNKPTRIAFAKQHIEDLTPRLNRLTIDVAPGAEAIDLVIELDDKELSDAVIGTAFPVDGGRHALKASADGYRSWKTSFRIGMEGEEMAVIIPELEERDDDEPDPDPDDIEQPKPKPKVDPDTDPDDGSPQRTIGYVVGGVGIASVIVGAIFGVRAITLRSESDDKCGDGDACPDTPEGHEGLEANEDAQTSATVANVLVGVGLGLVGVGLVVVLTAPSESESARIRVGPGALWLQGTF